MAASKFYTIQSSASDGYNLAQKGSRVCLAAANKDDPYQIWYVDETWSFLENAPVILVNHGSKKALDSRVIFKDVVKMSPYDPGTMEDDSFLWWFQWGKGPTVASIHCAAAASTVASIHCAAKSSSGMVLDLASNPSVEGGAAQDTAILLAPYVSRVVNQLWRIVPYGPVQLKIHCLWGPCVLTYKTPYQDTKYNHTPGVVNNELSIVVVNPDDVTSDNTMCYKIPAGGQQDTNYSTSFIIIHKKTGLALKGSSKPGDKVVAAPYDPFDYNFVWSEDRLNSKEDGVSISLAKDGAKNLHWYAPDDGQYQSKSWCHPLITHNVGDPTTDDHYLWKFVST